MGILDRLRGAIGPDDGLRRFETAVSEETDRLWVPLYLNEQLIGDVFAQRGPNVVEVATGDELSLELSAGYMAFVSGKAAKTKTVSQRIQITPLLQTMVLRDAAVDLTARRAEPADVLLRFVGPGRLVDDPVSSYPELGITPEIAGALQARREKQEARMRKRDPDHPGTVVLLACGVSPLASIASGLGGSSNLDSYLGAALNFGILGVPEPGLELGEDSRDSPLLLAPLMIWYHAGDL